MMGILVPETCSAYRKYNKIISGVQRILSLDYVHLVRKNLAVIKQSMGNGFFVEV